MLKSFPFKNVSKNKLLVDTNLVALTAYIKHVIVSLRHVIYSVMLICILCILNIMFSTELSNLRINCLIKDYLLLYSNANFR